MEFFVSASFFYSHLFFNILFSDYFMEQLRQTRLLCFPFWQSNFIELFDGGFQYEFIWTFFFTIYLYLKPTVFGLLAIIFHSSSAFWLDLTAMHNRTAWIFIWSGFKKSSRKLEKTRLFDLNYPIVMSRWYCYSAILTRNITRKCKWMAKSIQLVTCNH